MAARPPKSISLGGGRRVAALPSGAEDATRERLRHAIAIGEVGIEAGTRRLADPFEALGIRQKFDHDSKARNAVLVQAGQRFRRHWHGAGFDGLKAFDFLRESVDGGLGAQATTPTEAAIRHRAAYRRAAEAVGDRLLPYLKGIVIDAQPAANLCHLVSESGHARTAEALVQERLREALYRLVDHWGMADGRPSRRSAGQHFPGVQDV